MPTAMPRLAMAVLNVDASLVPKPRPMPIIGPISGLMSMAPMTTAVELTLRPIEQMMMLNTRIQRLNPRNSMSFLMPVMVCSASAKSIMRKRSMAKGLSKAMMRCKIEGGGVLEPVVPSLPLWPVVSVAWGSSCDMSEKIRANVYNVLHPCDVNIGFTDEPVPTFAARFRTFIRSQHGPTRIHRPCHPPASPRHGPAS